MYHLWTKVKLYHRPASEIIGLDGFCEDVTGLPGRDELTAWMFDSALEYFGRWIDSKSREVDKDNKLVHRLEDLLADKVMTVSKVDAVMGLFGAGEMISLETLLKDPAYIAQVEAGLVKPPPNWPTTQH
jgi:hypothetical protein